MFRRRVPLNDPTVVTHEILEDHVHISPGGGLFVLHMEAVVVNHTMTGLQELGAEEGSGIG